MASEPSVLAQPLEQMQLRAAFFLRVVGGSLDELMQARLPRAPGPRPYTCASRASRRACLRAAAAFMHAASAERDVYGWDEAARDAAPLIALLIIAPHDSPVCAQVPHVLTCDLNKVAMLRHAYCLANGIAVSPTKLLTRGTVTFCEETEGCNLDDLNAFEADGKHLSFFQGAEM